MRGRSRGLACGLVLAWSVLPAAGCGGGGGGGGGPTQPPAPPQPRVQFTADGPQEDTSIRLVGTSASNGTRLVLEIRAEEVLDLYGVSFDLRFPDLLLDWVASAAAEGDFLSDDGEVDTELLIDQRSQGSLLVGLSRLGVVGGAEGSGSLLTLEFNVVGNGSGDLVLADPVAVTSVGAIRTDLTWIGGSIAASGQ